MKSIIFLTLFSLLPFINWCQNSELLIPYRKKNLWGFADKNGNIKIKPKYTKVDFFYDNQANVSKQDLVGVIDINGNEIVPVNFYSCSSITPILYKVGIDGKFGIFNIFTSRVNLLCDEITHLTSHFYRIKEKEKFGVSKIVKDSIVKIIPPIFNKLDINLWLERLVGSDKNGNYHIFDFNGKKLKEIKVTEESINSLFPKPIIENYSDDIIMEEVYPRFKKVYKKNKVGLTLEDRVRQTNKRYSIIKKDIFPSVYDSINLHHTFQDCFVIRKNGKWGAINSAGEKIIDLEYDEIDIESMSFQSSRSKPYSQTFIVKKKKWGVIGNKNKHRKVGSKNIELIPFKYNSIRQNVNNSFFIIEKKGKYGVVLSKGFKLVTKIKYSDIKENYETIHDFILFIVKDKNGEEGFVGENNVEFFKN